MPYTEDLNALITALWESDEASALTNQAARMLEKLQAEVRQANDRHLAAVEVGMRIGREYDKISEELNIIRKENKISA